MYCDVTILKISLKLKNITIGLVMGLLIGLICGYVIVPIKGESSQNAQSSLETNSSYGNWSLVWEYKANHVIKKVSMSSDGNYITVIGDNYDSWRNDFLYVLTKNGELLWKRDSRELFDSSLGDWMHDVSVSQNTTYIAVGSEGATYLLGRNGSIIWKKEQMEGMNRVSISDDGEYIAIGTYPIGIGWVHFLNKSGQELWNFSAVGSVSSVSISKNGECIVAGDTKGYVYLLDMEGNLLWDKKLVGDYCHAIYVSISPNGEFIGIGMSIYYDYDRVAILNKNGDWLLNPIEVQHVVVGVSITSDGNFLFIPAESEGLRIYNANGELYSSFKARERVLDVHNTPEGVYVVIGSDDLRVYLLENPVIPEFTSAALMLALMLTTSTAFIIKRKKREGERN